MQENKERVEQKDEENVSEVLENQGSLFDDDEVFTEAIVVEKEQIDIDSSVEEKNNDEPVMESNGDTAEFVFSKDKPKNTEISHEELTVSDIESSAKEYYNANHAGDIEDKVRELCNLANLEFNQDNDSSEQVVSFDNLETEDDYSEAEELKKKKKKKRGYVSNDDMILLSSNDDGATLMDQVSQNEDDESQEPEVEEITSPEEAVREDVEVNSMVDEAQTDEEESEEYEEEKTIDEAEAELYKALGDEGVDSTEYLKKYEELYTDDDVEYEYTSKEQDGTILMNLRKAAMSSFSKMLLTLACCALCFYFEMAAVTKFPNPAFLEAGKFGVTYAMSMLQIMFICVILNLDGMKRAFKGLRPSKASAEAFTAVTCIVCTLHSVVSSLLVGNDSSLRSYCAVGCLALFMLSVNSFFKAETALLSFCVVSSKKPKFSCKNVDRASDEGVVFENYLDEDSTIVTVKKSNFVKDFFKKTQRVPFASKNSVKRIGVSLAISVVFGVVCGVIASDVYSGVKAFTAVCLMSLPVNALIVTALPFFKVSGQLTETQTAFIGEAVCDEYDDTNVISFEDTEVFPARLVRVSSIKTYENNRIDKVIMYMARIFDVAKGPLSFVFANSVHDIDETVGEAEIKSIYHNGIVADIDGKEVLVGQASFMQLYELTPVEDNIDETFVSSMGSIMYMAIDGVLAAKMYVKYAINKDFEPMLNSFYDSGVCVAVKTLDPCITTELVTGFLKGSDYPLAVINKGYEGTSMTEVSDSTESAIVSLSGVHNFLKGFIKSDKLRSVYRTNAVVSVVTSILGFLMTAAGIVLLGSGTVGVTFMVLLQIIMCIPVMLISLGSKY